MKSISLSFIACMMCITMNVTASPLVNNDANTVQKRSKENSLAFIGALQINQEDVIDEEHVPIGSREINKKEWLDLQQSRAINHTKRLSIAVEQFGDEAFAENDRKEIENTQCAAGVCRRAQKEDPKKTSDIQFVEDNELEPVTLNELQCKQTYFTSHPGAHHWPIAVSPFGDEVTLEDGSVWKVKNSHRYRTLDWFSSDDIVIFANHQWFSNYYYQLQNQTTGQYCNVNMQLGPIYNGAYTRWVYAIDYLNGEIILDDNSMWTIGSGSTKALKKWLLNDTVMIGINNAWFSPKPNILINVNVLDYVSADCQNGYIFQ